MRKAQGLASDGGTRPTHSALFQTAAAPSQPSLPQEANTENPIDKQNTRLRRVPGSQKLKLEGS